MGRISVNEAELRYPTNSGSKTNWFSIKNDRETKQVRFLYNTIDDVMLDVVHEVNINGRTQTIACLNSDGQNPNACPLCTHGHQQKVKLFVPVLDLSDNTVKIWTKGKNFVPQIQAIAARHNPISGVVIEVMRCGAPRDTNTQYTLMPITANDGATVQALGVQLPESSAYTRVMDYTQMNNYAITLDGGSNSAPAQTYSQYQNNNNYVAQPQYNGGYTQPTTTPIANPNVVQQSQTQAPYVPQATQPQNFSGSEPVRRTPVTQAPPASVPNYSNNATVPMQGIPQRPPVAQPQSYTNAVETDEDLPF